MSITLSSISSRAGNGGDDSQILYDATTKALNEGVAVDLEGKTYNFDKPYRETRNSVVIKGGGCVSNRLKEIGGVLNSRISNGNCFYFAGRQVRIKELTFSGVTNDWVVESHLNQLSKISDIHLNARGKYTSGMLVRNAWSCKYQDIDLVKRRDAKKGIGFWHDTSSASSGGLVKFDNIHSSYFKNNLEFGQEEKFNRDPRQSNSIVNCQGRHGETGIRIGSGYLNTRMSECWAEMNSYAQVQVHSGAGPVMIENLTNWTTSAQLGLVLGLDPEKGDNVPIQGVTVRGGRIRSKIGGSCVRIFAPDEIVPDQWHELDQVQMWPQTIDSSRVITVDTVPQMPIVVKRPMNRAITNNNRLMVNTSGVPYTAPLVLQTQP